MPLLARMVATPLHIDVRAGAIGDLFGILADTRISTHGRVAVVVGPGVGDEVRRALAGDVGPDDVFVVREDTLDEATALAAALRIHAYDVVVGIGGGRTLDVTKHASSRLGLPMVAVATSLAHDGIASPVSVLRVDGGRASYGVSMPIGVIVDLDMVRRSPHALVASGVGDLISNLSAVADWRLARDMRGERFDGLAATFAHTAAEAVLHRRDDPTGLPFLECLAESLILSGMAMAVAGTSRPCSGGCHEISHAIDELHPGLATHGQQVGVGMLLATYLRGDLDTLAAAARCLAHHGMPTDHRQLGLSDDELVTVIAHAPSTRSDRYTILEHLSLSTSTATAWVEAFPTVVADALACDARPIEPALVR